MKLLMLFIVTLAVCGAQGYPVIDDTPTRVQTTLKVDMRLVGTLRPKPVGEISTSRWTVDCAGMDREHVDWRAIREYVAPLGIARMRLQAGWARCEKDPGKYDFAWLDQAVFDAKAMGVDTWLELSYGNPAYPGGGGRHLSAGFPVSAEALAAWDRWVEAIVTHYKGVIRDFCIWNEPDLNRNNDPQFAVQFAIRTAEIIKRIEPKARIDAFALCSANREFIEPFLKELAKRGKTDLFTSVAYHHYSENPDAGFAKVESCKKMVAKYAPGLKMKEGEGGTQSEWCRTGALSGIHWTELTQAKYNLRRALGDLGHGDDTDVFHICDLEYRTSGFHEGLVRYGLLKTAGQAKRFRVYKVKMSYYAVQNAVSVFNDALMCLDYRTTSKVSDSDKTFVCDWIDRKAGAQLVVFWDRSRRPSDENRTRMLELRINAKPFENPVWVDILTGNAYAIPADRIRKEGEWTVYYVPCYDSPSFVTDRGILNLESSWFVREGCPADVRIAPTGMRPFDHATVYGPVEVSERSFLVSESDIRLNCGEGRVLNADDGRFQLMQRGIFDSEKKLGKYVVLKLWSRQPQRVLFCWRNDYYGALAVNGRVVDGDIGGPETSWETKPIELKGGDNEIVFLSMPGTSGEWFLDAGLVYTDSESVVR
jgi:hypothetical protein